MHTQCDVAIIGGGPAGSTVGTLLCKYNPRLNVQILERERFPRDHVGESQLPIISQVLDEMECWDQVESAGFPIKIGATYRWGKSPELWDFEFIPDGKLEPAPRPGKYAGQRTQTAFQVDRAIYDDILLRHAQSMGCKVHQEAAVRKVLRTGDRVEGLVLDSGATVVARHYVDASGHGGILRRAMDVQANSPTNLQNIAIWDYWQNAEWAVSIGVGGTRVQVMSLGYGWIWFIPLGPTRTSVGLIVPAEYYKQQNVKPRDLYDRAISEEPVVSKLLKTATREDKLATTKDWSFLAERLVGENWFLAGESCGFADPILAAGMTLAHLGARDVAYTILALDQGVYEADWLRQRYCETHRTHIRQHIRFADFWYTQNGVFTDLQEEAKRIAGDVGLKMSAQDAWRWLGTGGFIDHDHGGTGFSGFSVLATKEIAAAFTEDRPHFEIEGKTHFALNLEGAQKAWGANHFNGRIERHRAYRRADKSLPYSGIYRVFIDAMKTGERTFEELCQIGVHWLVSQGMTDTTDMTRGWAQFMDVLESLAADGWVRARQVEGFAGTTIHLPEENSIMHPNRDIALSIEVNAGRS
jgi:flavin-dependent dehydrogenase